MCERETRARERGCRAHQRLQAKQKGWSSFCCATHTAACFWVDRLGSRLLEGLKRAHPGRRSLQSHPPSLLGASSVQTLREQASGGFCELKVIGASSRISTIEKLGICKTAQAMCSLLPNASSPVFDERPEKPARALSLPLALSFSLSLWISLSPSHSFCLVLTHSLSLFPFQARFPRGGVGADQPRKCVPRDDHWVCVQGYLAYQKQRPFGTLQ